MLASYEQRMLAAQQRRQEQYDNIKKTHQESQDKFTANKEQKEQGEIMFKQQKLTQKLQRAEENRQTIIEQKMQKASRNSLKVQSLRKANTMAPLRGIDNDPVMNAINETTSPWEEISDDGSFGDYQDEDKNDYSLSLPIKLLMGGLKDIKGQKKMKSVQQQVMIVDGKKFTFNINVDIQIDPIEAEESATN